MKTDELVALLARNAGALETGAAGRRFSRLVAWGLPATALLVLLVLGVRPDFAIAVPQPMFWLKLAFPAAIAVLSVRALQLLATPGAGLGGVPGLMALLVAVLWLWAGSVLAEAEPFERRALILGESWQFCLVSVCALSIPVLAAALWTMRQSAPTRPALAGATAGLLAGGVGASAYALHCTEMSMPFLAVWYVLGMLAAAAAGASLGPRMLRW